MRRIFCLGAIALLGGGLCRARAPEGQPIYLYLLSRYTDQFNIEMTEDRLRRTLPMLERQQKLHESGFTAILLFSGAVSEALEDRNRKTGIKDFVLDYARRGVVELGYDGTDEPTYHRRSLPDLFTPKTPEERWFGRVQAAGKFLTEARDLMGNLRPGRSGGLKKMQEVFGEAACITGVT